MTLVFPGAVIGGFSATGVVFDGTDNLSRSGGPTGIADAKTGTLSVWCNGAGSAATRYLIYGGTSGRFRILMLDNAGGDANCIQVLGLTAAGAVAISMRSTAAVNDSSWHHVLMAWDTATAASCLVYVDGSDVTSIISRTDAAIDYASGDMWVGCANTGGSSHYAGDVAELYFTTEWLDISDSTVREKFAKSGKPVYLGADGSKPSGTQPILYFKGPASTFDTNLGSGGAFTASGTFTDASTKPSY